jgi:hypothetical protein
MKRLEAKCWDGMMKPDSPLYEPLLAALFSGQKGNRKDRCPPVSAANWVPKFFPDVDWIGKLSMMMEMII